ncbi:hypothetical protein B1748_11505 [Paenibacillus sp. MY03]|nr:hypothetical protein B1748_11505 [Paenibacillus sp. MY03]
MEEREYVLLRLFRPYRDFEHALTGGSGMKLSNVWHSIQFKLTVSFLVILLPLVVVSVIANVYSQRMMYDQITERTRGALLTALEYVDQLTKNIEQQSLLISSNPEIVNVWMEADDPLNLQYLYDMRMIQQQLSALISVNPAVREAFIVHGQSGSGISTLQGGVKWKEIGEEQWFQDALEANGGLSVYMPDAAQQNESRYLEEGYIYYARLLDVFNSNSQDNVLVIVIDKHALNTVVQHLQTSEHIKTSLLYLDQLVLTSNSTVQSSNNMFSIEESNGIWSIQMEQPESELFKQPYYLELMTYLIIMISILLALCLAWLVYSEISKPMRKLFGAIKLFSGGHLLANIKHGRKDEFGLLMDAFNRMAESQRKLIEDDYEKELKLARSEFSLLQSQINPHFLYNTLDSIYSVADKHQIKEIGEMVLNLAQFFRFSLGKGKETFTLEETIQHLMYYIRVQQIRTDQFTVEMDIAEDTKPIPVLKLLLQPIVENAIVHGICKSSYGGDLYIRSRLVDGFLKITIEDTGCGIADDELTEIKQELQKINAHSYRYIQEKEFSKYFGLKNVVSRMKMYYGNHAEMTIDHNGMGGTRVTVTLPIERDEPA